MIVQRTIQSSWQSSKAAIIFLSVLGVIVLSYKFNATPNSEEHNPALFVPRQDDVLIPNPPQPYVNKSNLLFFSHIPRTGGGTFSRVLRAVFPRERICPLSSDSRAIRPELWPLLRVNITAAMWQRWAVLFVHEDLSILRWIKRDVNVITFIRDPFRHRRSVFFWNLFTAYDEYKGDQLRWIQSVDYPHFYQLEWMAGVTTRWPFTRDHTDAAVQLRCSPEKMLRKAKENLLRTTFFGITERWNESLCLFYYTHEYRPPRAEIDWKSIHTVPRRPASPELFEEEHRSQLKLEYEFFNWAVRLFDARVKWMQQDYKQNAERKRPYVSEECKGIL